MAEEKKPKTKKIVVKKKRESVRERADKSTAKAAKAPRTRKITTAAMKPVGKIGSVLGKEFHVFKTGDSKTGRFLGKRTSLTPMYFIEAFRELKKVTWPSRKTAAKLTGAVFIFSVSLAAVVKGLDLLFDKLFKEVILK
jgi:preprotein translocase SecE subunit